MSSDLWWTVSRGVNKGSKPSPHPFRVIEPLMLSQPGFATQTHTLLRKTNTSNNNNLLVSNQSKEIFEYENAVCSHVPAVHRAFSIASPPSPWLPFLYATRRLPQQPVRPYLSLRSLCKLELCLTITGSKIILHAQGQVIKLNFRPVDQINSAN